MLFNIFDFECQSISFSIIGEEYCCFKFIEITGLAHFLAIQNLQSLFFKISSRFIKKSISFLQAVSNKFKTYE